MTVAHPTGRFPCDLSPLSFSNRISVWGFSLICRQRHLANSSHFSLSLDSPVSHSSMYISCRGLAVLCCGGSLLVPQLTTSSGRAGTFSYSQLCSQELAWCLVTDKFLISIFVHITLKVDTGFLRQGQIITYVSNLRQEALSL